MALARIEEKVFIIKLESSRGDAEAVPTSGRSLPVLPASEVNLNPNLLDNEKIYGDPERRAQQGGVRDYAGTLELEPGADKLGELINSLIGACTSTEEEDFTVTLNTNDWIDFNEGAGEFNAQLTAGTYLAGATDAVVGSLCEEIKTVLEAAGAGTYGVAFSYTTRKFTITQSAGTGTFEILWKTGTHGSDLLDTHAGDLLGYTDTADDDGAVAYTSDTASDIVFGHVFQGGAATHARHALYTLFVDRDAAQMKYGGMGVSQMTFNVPVDGRLAVSADVIAKTEAAGTALSPDFSTDLENLIFDDVTLEVAGVSNTNVRSASAVINHNAVAKRVLNASRDAADIVAGMLDVSGAFQLYFEDETERDKFVASSTTSLKIIVTGQVVKNALTAYLEIDMPQIKYDAAPVAEQDGTLIEDFTYRASRGTAGYSVKLTLRNKNINTYA